MIAYDPETDKITEVQDTGGDSGVPVWDRAWDNPADVERMMNEAKQTKEWQDLGNGANASDPMFGSYVAGPFSPPGFNANAPNPNTPSGAPQATTPGEYAWGKPPVDYAGHPTYGGTYAAWVNDVIHSYAAPDPTLYPELFAAWNQAHAGEPLFNAVHGLGTGGTFIGPGGEKLPYYDLATQAKYPNLNLMPPATAYFAPTAPQLTNKTAGMTYPTSPIAPGYPNYPGAFNAAPPVSGKKLDYTSKVYNSALAAKPVQDTITKWTNAHGGIAPSQAQIDDLIVKYLNANGIAVPTTGGLAPTAPLWTQDKLPNPPPPPRAIGAGALFQTEPWTVLGNRLAVNYNPYVPTQAYYPTAPSPYAPTSYGVNPLPRYLRRI